MKNLKLMMMLASMAVAPAGWAATATVPERAASQPHAAVDAFLSTHPAAEVQWRDGQPGPALVLGLTEVLPGATVEARADHFLKQHAAILGIAFNELRFIAASHSKNRTVIRYEQVARLGGRTLPVLEREVTLTFDAKTGLLLQVVSDAMPTTGLVAGKLDRAHATDAAARFAGIDSRDRVQAEEAVIATSRGARHVWLVHLSGRSPADLRTVAIDALSGEPRLLRAGVSH